MWRDVPRKYFSGATVVQDDLTVDVLASAHNAKYINASKQFSHDLSVSIRLI